MTKSFGMTRLTAITRLRDRCEIPTEDLADPPPSITNANLLFLRAQSLSRSLAPPTLLVPISLSSLSATVPVPWQRGTRRESNGFTDYVSVARNKRVAEERSARGDCVRARFYLLRSISSVRAAEKGI